MHTWRLRQFRIKASKIESRRGLSFAARCPMSYLHRVTPLRLPPLNPAQGQSACLHCRPQSFESVHAPSQARAWNPDRDFHGHHTEHIVATIACKADINDMVFLAGILCKRCRPGANPEHLVPGRKRQGIHRSSSAVVCSGAQSFL